MSTLFDNYYDCLGHEMQIGMTVEANTSGGIIYGHIVEMFRDNKGEDKFTIIPDIGYSNIAKLRKSYKIGWKNVYQIIVKMKSKS